MFRQRSHRRSITLTLVVLSVAALGSGCQSSDSDSNDGPGNQDVFSSSLLKYTDQTGALSEALLEALRIQTGDFSSTIAEAPELDDTQRGQFDLALQGALVASAGPVNAGFALLETQKQLASEIQTTEASSRLGQQKSNLLGTLLFVAGVALTGYSAYRGVAKAVDQRAEPARKALAAASGAELQEMNRTLDLPADTSSADAVAHFNELGIGKMTTAMKEIEAVNRDPEVGSFSASNDVAASVANASQTLGETGLTTYASTVGSAGWGKLGQATGRISGTAADVIDLTINGVSAATGKSLQPLDLMASHASVVAADQDTRRIEIPQASEEMSTDEASSILAGVDSGASIDTVSTTQLADAAATMARDFVDQHADEVGATDSGGTLSANVSQQVHVVEADDLRHEAKLAVPKMGPSTVIAALEGEPAQIVPDIDTDAPSPSVTFQVGVESAPDNSAGTGSCAGTPIEGTCLVPFMAALVRECMGVQSNSTCTHDIDFGIAAENKATLTCWSNGASMMSDLVSYPGGLETTYTNANGDFCATQLFKRGPDGTDTTYENAAGEQVRIIIDPAEDLHSVTCPGNTAELYGAKELVDYGVAHPDKANCVPAFPVNCSTSGSCQ